MRNKFLTNAFLKPQTKQFILTNDLLVMFTLVSIAGITLETVGSLQPYKFIFDLIEYVTVFFFSIEYIARLTIAKIKA